VAAVIAGCAAVIRYYQHMTFFAAAISSKNSRIS